MSLNNMCKADDEKLTIISDDYRYNISQKFIPSFHMNYSISIVQLELVVEKKCTISSEMG